MKRIKKQTEEYNKWREGTLCAVEKDRRLRDECTFCGNKSSLKRDMRYHDSVGVVCLECWLETKPCPSPSCEEGKVTGKQTMCRECYIDEKSTPKVEDFIYQNQSDGCMTDLRGLTFTTAEKAKCTKDKLKARVLAGFSRLEDREGSR